MLSPGSGEGAGQRTRHPFSHIFGNAEGFGKNKERKLTLRDHWKEHLKPQVEAAAGIPLRDPNTKTKTNAPPPPTEFHREMFSKAAARLAQI